jgi:glycosyltransferase involved in cell wall biosynthesis
MASSTRKAHFSVVTPNLNMGGLLERTIESVLRNLEDGDEYFVIDGGSSDGSVNVIQRYEQRLTGWVSERDNGQYDAIAKGFRSCCGDFHCWVNSGDLLLPGALREARRALQEYNADLVFGDDLYIDANDKILAHSRAKTNRLKNRMLYGSWTPLQDACFWRRSLYDRIGGLAKQLKYAGDYDLFLRASCRGTCVYVPHVFSAFRKHAGQHSVKAAELYNDERKLCRDRMIRELGIGQLNAALNKKLYWGLVRWRLFVGRRFSRSWLAWGLPCDPRGSVFSLMAKLCGARFEFSVTDFDSGKLAKNSN